MKKIYDVLTLEVIRFDSVDILTESGDTPLPETGEP